MRSPIIERILKRTPLKTTLFVANQIAMIDLLARLGIRDGYWKDEEDEMLSILTTAAEELAEWQVKEIEQFKKDQE